MQFVDMQCNSDMGLMPLIKRAWLTIDSTIYMWNYENGLVMFYVHCKNIHTNVIYSKVFTIS